MNIRRFILIFLVTTCVISQPSLAQSAKEYEGEFVMSADGKLVAPWSEWQMCEAKDKNCRTVIYRRDTREVASVDGRWSTKFEQTRRGKEVRRAEAAVAKAIRLKSSAAVN